ncbi:hypothetical protein D770_09975 [Flammeovirgaceae bacterium 311]|nr:hypothetical protein D770_09975 [Flammeovirgaceae bacterium 311]
MCSKKLDGRLGKTFCTDLCRSKYHNRKKSADERCVRAINKVLNNNRQALKEIGTGEQTKLHKDVLVEKGFNFDFFTHTKEHKGRTYKFCYDWGYYIKSFGDIEISQLDENSLFEAK